MQFVYLRSEMSVTFSKLSFFKLVISHWAKFVRQAKAVSKHADTELLKSEQSQ